MGKNHFNLGRELLKPFAAGGRIQQSKALPASIVCMNGFGSQRLPTGIAVFQNHSAAQSHPVKPSRKKKTY